MNNYSYTFLKQDFSGTDNVGVSYDLVKICELNSCIINKGVIIVYNRADPLRYQEFTFWYDFNDNSPTIRMGIINDITHIKLVCTKCVGVTDTDRHSKLVYIVKDLNGACFIAVAKNIYNNAIVKIDITTDTSGATYEPLSECKYNRYVSFSELDSYVQASNTKLNRSIVNYNDHSYFCLAENVKQYYTKILFRFDQTFADKGLNSTGSVEILLMKNKLTIEISKISANWGSSLLFYYTKNDDGSYNIFMHQTTSWENFELISFDPIYYSDSLPENAVQTFPIYHSGESSFRTSLNSCDQSYQYFDTTLNKPVWWSGTTWIDATGILAGTSTSGTFANKPTVSDNAIPVGFRYFCTDKQTIEGATNGIEIIHKGSDIWVDALGRTVE